MRFIFAAFTVSLFFISCSGYESDNVENDGADTVSNHQSPYNTPGATDNSQPNE